VTFTDFTYLVSATFSLMNSDIVPLHNISSASAISSAIFLSFCSCFMEQSSISSTSGCSSRNSFYFKLACVCLIFQPLFSLRSWKPISFTFPFLLSRFSPRLSQDWYLLIDQASSFHLTHISLSFTVISFTPVAVLGLESWGAKLQPGRSVA